MVDFRQLQGGHETRVQYTEDPNVLYALDYSTIGGGFNNTIQTNLYTSTIGGGANNTIQPYANDSTIGGGGFNVIKTNAYSSTIGGGGNSATKSLDASYPSDSAGVQVTAGSNPRYWTAAFSGSAPQTAFAICVPN